MAHVEIGFYPGGRAIREGHPSLSRMISPAPFFTAAAIGLSSSNNLVAKLPNSNFLDDWKIIFREDYFDPLGRVRRGRFYFTKESPSKHWVFEFTEGRETTLRTFESGILSDFFTADPTKLSILLGTTELYSPWRVVMWEYTSNGEISVTLRSRSMMGILPDLNLPEMPQEHSSRIKALAEKLASEVPRGMPETIVEGCRSLASAVLIAANQLINPQKKAEDLGDEADFFQDHVSKQRDLPRYSIAHCAKTVARLHAEAKPVSQVSSGCVPPTERDAELAVGCVSRIITALGWGA